MNILRSMAAGAVIVGLVSALAVLTLLRSSSVSWATRWAHYAFPSWKEHRVSRHGRGPDLAGLRKEGRAARRCLLGRGRRPHGRGGGTGVGLHIGQSGVATLPVYPPSKQGYLAVEHYFPNQDPYPVEIVVKGEALVARADLGELRPRCPATSASVRVSSRSLEMVGSWH